MARHQHFGWPSLPSIWLTGGVTSRLRPTLSALLAALLAAASAASAQQAGPAYSGEGDIRTALVRAQAEGRAAQLRAERLEAEAARASQAADRTAREAAGLAARIQQGEARIAVHEARIRLIDRQRAGLRQRLARQQQPLVRLTAALQHLSRRPPVFSLLRPGSVEDAVHMRALLESMLPEVQRRTAGVRRDLAAAQRLRARAQAASRDLRRGQAELAARRRALVALETRQRLAERAAGSSADREADRALAMAEQARDLDDLATTLAKAGELRASLAALPGPVLRPVRPEEARIVEAVASPTVSLTALPSYMLPVTGRLVAGFGEASGDAARTRGIALAPRAGAQVVAPAAGRVAFAGKWRSYGQIVILEHPGGWTSLVTGMVQLDTRVGASLVAGSPLGIAGAGQPRVTLELRRGGEPVNPLDFVAAP